MHLAADRGRPGPERPQGRERAERAPGGPGQPGREQAGAAVAAGGLSRRKDAGIVISLSSGNVRAW